MEKEQYYQELRKAIESVIGQEPKTLQDFSQLEDRLQATVGQRLSGTTLRRFWGYQEKDKSASVSASTLKLLSRFAGYTDFESFCLHVDNGKESQSGYIIQNTIHSDELVSGDRIIVTWNPGRQVEIRHLGNSRFVVESSIASKLQAGDTFTCHLFIEHTPLYLTDITRADQTFPSYVCGRQDGILFHKKNQTAK